MRDHFIENVGIQESVQPDLCVLDFSYDSYHFEESCFPFFLLHDQ